MTVIALLGTTTLFAFWRLGYFSAPPIFVKNVDGLNQNIPAVVNGPWDHGHANKIHALVGQPLEKVRHTFGCPNQENEFSMGDSIDEFRVELLNTYPPGDPRSIGVRIKEWIWRYPGFSVAVWFHLENGQWVVLDTCRWKDGVAF
jgi:hypothetical protein